MIVADDFIKSRPKSRRRRESAPKSVNPNRIYKLASSQTDNSLARLKRAGAAQLGITVWKLQSAGPSRASLQTVAVRVPADTQFQKGDLLRLSIESPSDGYLYVVDRDWFPDGSSGEMKLIFPVTGDDNRLRAGSLIDIPSEDQPPFRASPKPNQTAEMLTIIVTSSPLKLSTTRNPQTISSSQLMEWEARWGGSVERFEMTNGTGQIRTKQEDQAAFRWRPRQLTRDDPGPQTIYVVTPRSSGGLLFNLKLSYQ